MRRRDGTIPGTERRRVIQAHSEHAHFPNLNLDNPFLGALGATLSEWRAG